MRRLRRRNHVVRAAAARGSEVSRWKSVEATAWRSCMRSLEKRGQLSMTCFAVSHCHPQGHAGDLKPGTRHLCRKSARPIFPVQI